MDEDNDGRFSNDSLVAGSLPADGLGAAGRPVGVAVAAGLDSGSVWAGRVARVCGGPRAGHAGQWRPASGGTLYGDLFYPCCFREASEIRRVTDGEEG